MRHINTRQNPASIASVENYTNAFLAIACLILFMGFFTLAATKGYIWVALGAALMDLAIKIGGARNTRARQSGKDG